jgi:hypothetical protein
MAADSASEKSPCTSAGTRPVGLRRRYASDCWAFSWRATSVTENGSPFSRRATKAAKK